MNFKEEHFRSKPAMKLPSDQVLIFWCRVPAAVNTRSLPSALPPGKAGNCKACRSYAIPMFGVPLCGGVVGVRGCSPGRLHCMHTVPIYGACDDGFSGRRTVTPYLPPYRPGGKFHTTPAHTPRSILARTVQARRVTVICDDESRGALGGSCSTTRIPYWVGLLTGWWCRCRSTAPPVV